MLCKGVGGEPGNGPYIVLNLEICGNQIVEGDFEANGCPAAYRAACTALTVFNSPDNPRWNPKEVPAYHRVDGIAIADLVEPFKDTHEPKIIDERCWYVCTHKN